jgi:hypothetical protein
MGKLGHLLQLGGQISKLGPPSKRANLEQPTSVFYVKITLKRITNVA